jgi:protein-S-isoprenylcysteine O-methyltransferase Ste14
LLIAINLKLLVAQIAILFSVIALLLFLPAGTIAWLSGWTFLVLFFGFVIAITVWLYRNDPGLLQERMTLFKPDQEPWDKALLTVTQVLFLAWLILMPLDAVRFRWSQMPVSFQAIGAIILMCSFYLFFLTFRENPFLSSAVHIQKERGHTVVSTGPYRYVRHPMYSAFIPFVFGTALLLGSWYGVLFGLIHVIIVARRAVLEERMLRKELKGYDRYMDRVKYRLIPCVW